MVSTIAIPDDLARRLADDGSDVARLRDTDSRGSPELYDALRARHARP